jgi:hypothetical protein
MTGGASGVLRGAVSLNILGEGCSLSDQFLDFPRISDGHPVTATEFRELVADGGAADGDGIASVSCAWRTRSMSGGISIDTGVDSKFVSLGSTIVLGETSTGGISIDSSSLPDAYGSSPDDPCVYSPIEVDEATNTIWGEFSCGILVNFDGDDSCELGPSYFYFENCPDQ